MENMLGGFPKIDIKARWILRWLSITQACAEDRQNSQEAYEMKMISRYQTNSSKPAKAYHTCAPLAAEQAQSAYVSVGRKGAASSPSATILV
jgi:hypothetical protein